VLEAAERAGLVLSHARWGPRELHEQNPARGPPLCPQVTAEDLTPEAVRAYRDALERSGRSLA
jgi:hypothetical protein